MSSANESAVSEHSTSEVLHQLTREDLSKSLLDVVTESWRLSRLFSRVLDRLGSEEQSRYRSQFSWFDKKLENALGQIDLKIVMIEGHPFDTGLPVTVLNLEEFKPDDTLTVDQMIEPIIMGPSGIVRPGTVTVKRTES